MPEETLTLLFSHIDPLYELHASFLKDIEQRMATWSGVHLHLHLHLLLLLAQTHAPEPVPKAVPATLPSSTREGRGNAHLQGDYRKIGDVILKNLNQNTIEHYARFTHGLQCRTLHCTGLCWTELH